MSISTSSELLEKVIITIGPASAVQLLKSEKFKGYELHAFYKIAQSNGLDEVTGELLKSEQLLNQFKFLEGQERRWIEARDFGMLDLPIFATYRLSFRDVIEIITGNYFNRYVLKEFGKLSLRFGVRALNNWMFFKSLYRSKRINIHDFFQLDHTVVFKRYDSIQTFLIEPVIAHYNLRRCVRLLKSPAADASRFGNLLMRFESEERYQVLKRFPRKPKDISDLNRWLERELGRLAPPEKELDQIIKPWNNRMIGPFRVQVPCKVKDLTELSQEMRNCLDTYPTKVLRKDCQVLILEGKEGVKLGVELNKTKAGWRVKDILGTRNDPTYQWSKGKFLREELNHWCGELDVSEDLAPLSRGQE